MIHTFICFKNRVISMATIREETITVKKVTITIKKEQAKFIKDNTINLSRFVQNAITAYRKNTYPQNIPPETENHG